MAVLDRPHWETVEADLREVLRLLGRQSFAQRFCLAGGTALALQLGHLAGKRCFTKLAPSRVGS